MRIVPERSMWAQLATFLAAMILGPVGALNLALRLAPGSDLVQGASVLAAGTIFVGGLLIWMGIGVVTVVVGLVAVLVRGRRAVPAPFTDRDRAVPPGYVSFAVLGACFGAAVGLLAGLLTPLTVIGATTIWCAAGLAYGAALTLAARTGYLPFPEPE